MTRSLNGYQLKPVCHKASSLDHFFPYLYQLLIRQFTINSKNLFAADTSFFSVVNDSISANVLNNGLQRISQWADKWKMSFNPDLNKQT